VIDGKRCIVLSANGKRATEVERCGNLKLAVQRLKESDAKQKVLQVPTSDMQRVVKALKAEGISGTVKNLSGTKRKSV
jgi:hypothetical protein